MDKPFIFTALITLPLISSSQDQTMLLDQVTVEDLKEEPYKEWYDQQYSTYHIDKETTFRLSQELHDLQFEIYFGTWCGDSRREVPRFLKLVDEAGIKNSSIKLIGVDLADGAYKQSPSQSERHLSIYRVPTFRILKNGLELGRIVEYPVRSLEEDLALILNNELYQPNYHSFPIIDRWLEEGILRDPNCNVRGLANQLRNYLHHFTEINSVAHVLYDQGRTDESIILYRINAYLFSDNASCQVMLARTYAWIGDIENSISAYKHAWRLEPGNDDIFEELLAVASKAEN